MNPLALLPEALPQPTTGPVALLHADGALPNHALMCLSAHFRDRGRETRLVRPTERRHTLFGDRPAVYGSSIFAFSSKARALLDAEWGPVTWGGTGVRVESSLAEIDPHVDWDSVKPDYSLYPDFDASMGFTQRGCRLSCKFCVVPKKEGKPRSVSTTADIWRGPGHPKKLVLHDNDFFGQPKEEWRERLREFREGNFRVCLSQGINIRMIDDESAAALAGVEYRDTSFSQRVLYTAWDNLGDEQRFKDGVATLARHGIPPKHLRVYMLVGFAKDETMEAVLYRFHEMRALGCEPYPMPYDRTNKRLREFQRWAIRLSRSGDIPWESYDPHVSRTRAAVGDAGQTSLD